MSRLQPTNLLLNFYIDKPHFPYQFSGDCNFDDEDLLSGLGGCNTWLLWTLRTYLELRKIYQCRLTDNMPESGIVLFFRGSVGLTEKPNKDQFWVCMVADTTWHPYSQVNLFQNAYWINKYPQSYFIRHWPQLDIIKSRRNGVSPQNIAYFGDLNNLAAELKSEDWTNFIAANDYTFNIPPSTEWNDFTNVDLVIGIRSFDKNENFLSKPSSKLINSWRANAVFISGNDSACLYEKEDEFDFVEVADYDALKNVLSKIKDDKVMFGRYRSRAIVRGERFSDSFFVNQWTDLIDKKLIPAYSKSLQRNSIERAAFIARRFSMYKWAALTRRIRNLPAMRAIYA